MARMAGALPDFLRKHKIYKQFVSNLKMTYPKLTSRYYFSKYMGASAIKIAFDWARTDEGWAYWEDIDALWRNRQ